MGGGGGLGHKLENLRNILETTPPLTDILPRPKLVLMSVGLGEGWVGSSPCGILIHRQILQLWKANSHNTSRLAFQ